MKDKLTTIDWKSKYSIINKEYKLKENCSQYILSAAKIINPAFSTIGIISNSHDLKKLKDAGVLDLWFEEVIIPKEIKANIVGKNKSLECVVMKGFILADGKKISIDSIKKLVNSKWEGYDISIQSINIGCVEGIERNEIERILDLEKTL